MRASRSRAAATRSTAGSTPRSTRSPSRTSWKVNPVVGTALPTAQFGGGQPRKLTLQLLFDSTDSQSLDVTDVTQQLFNMMEVQSSLGSGSGRNSGRPPMVTFVWGSVVSFKAVADSLSVQYTLFRADGTPVRAQAQLSLMQAERAMDKSSQHGSAAPQNPTTRAQPGLGSHTVQRRRQPRLDRLPALPRPDPLALDRRGERDRRPAPPEARLHPLDPEDRRMSGVSGAEVRVGGTKLDDSVGQRLVEARIQENLRLPDACLLRFSDPNLKTIDQFPIQIGSEIEVLLSAIDATSLTSIFKGKVVSLEPEFAAGHDSRLPGLRRLAPAPPDEDRRRPTRT